MLGSPPRSKIAPRTPEWFAGNPPQPKSTGWGRVSQGDTQLHPYPQVGSDLCGSAESGGIGGGSALRYLRLRGAEVRVSASTAAGLTARERPIRADQLHLLGDLTPIMSTVSVSKLAAVAMLSLSLSGAPGDVAVVVGPNTPVDNLSFADVRKLFMGDRQYWNSNLRVTLLIRAPAARERDVVLKTIY